LFDVSYGTSYIASAYVKVPTGEASILADIVVNYYNSSKAFVASATAGDITLSSSDGWTRLFLNFTIASSSVAYAAVAIQDNTASPVSGDTFLVDAVMVSTGSLLTPFVEPELPQAVKNQAANLALTKLPQPHLTGMKLRGDVRINGLTLNTVDENDVVWVCRDIEGWWNLSNVDTPDIARGLDDGSYDVRGRRTARSLTIEGSILVPDPSLTAYARQKLMEAFNLVYEGAWLYVDESPTKAAYVRLVGQPTMSNTNARGRIDFSIPLRAGDPIKYDWQETNANGHTAVGLSNLIANPSFESGSTTGWTATGGTGTASTTFAYVGTYSYRISATGSTTIQLSQSSTAYYPAVTEGYTYTFSIYGLDSASPNNTSAVMNPRIAWYDSSYTLISTVLGPFTTLSTSWARMAITAIAPDNAAYAHCYLVSTANITASRLAYFDAAQFELNTSATTYANTSVSNLAITNSGNADVAAVYRLTGPITAPAYIVSTSGNTTQTITVNTNLRDTTASSSISASEFAAGVATLTTSAANSFMVGDRVVVDASNNYYDGTVTLTAATDTSVSYANPIANVTSITHSSNRADVTTATAHNLTSGTTFFISGSSNPVLDGAYTVLASPTITSTTFSYTKTTSNQTTGYGGTMSRQISYSAGTTGTITLAQVDTLEIDTYNKTVLYRGLSDSSRSTVAINVDWIQLAPGENLHTFSKTGGTGSAEVKYRSGWIG
jgi:cyclophilin family peptidyl-prolyl cis-trans isomerase